MNINELYELWLKNAREKELADELSSIQGNNDEISDRFYRSLEFGTAGLRGVLGAGTNRMNIYTVGQATQGFADYVNRNYEKPSVAIAYDSRNNSELFAKRAASVFAANGVAVYIFPELVPTPVLSFAVRELKCSGGVIVTASHNPAKYNGYKCYGPEGFQMTDEAAEETYEFIKASDIFTGVKVVDFESAVSTGMIKYIEESVLEKFFKCLMKNRVHPDACEKAELSVVYTPLNGTGNKPVREILRRTGVSRLKVVPEQELPDGNFPTCPYPNPELREALKSAIIFAEKNPCDLILATDPDCDRVTATVFNGEDYRTISGNEMGVLLLEYLLSQRKKNGTLPKAPVALKSLVSTGLTELVAKKYGCEVVNLLTGFKYIGEFITKLEARDELDRFILGFEESCGYLCGAHARDKDAVVASMLICEMAAHYKLEGKTLLDVLNGIEKEHGVFLHNVLNIAFEGETGMAAMKRIMDGLREKTPQVIAGLNVIAHSDYQTGECVDMITGKKTMTGLPESNMLIFKLDGGTEVIVRPSGTEPKIKIYLTVRAENNSAANCLMAVLRGGASRLTELK